MDTRLALMCGSDIPVPECQLIIHQPRIREISFIGEQDFFAGAQCICLNKKMLQDNLPLEDTSNFQIFMKIMAEKETAEKKFAVQQLFTLLFPTQSIIFTPRSLLVKSEEGMITIDDNNFSFLQEAVAQICCLKSGPMDQQVFNPADEQAKAIADKLMRGRARVAAQKGSQNNVSLFSQYISTLTVGLSSMSIKDVMDLTVYQLYDLVERYMLYINWDIDMRSRLAGAKPDSPAENWMKNIH